MEDSIRPMSLNTATKETVEEVEPNVVDLKSGARLLFSQRTLSTG